MILLLSLLSLAQSPDEETSSEIPKTSEEQKTSEDQKLSRAYYQTAKRLLDKTAYKDAVEAYLLSLAHAPPIVAYKEIAQAYQFLGDYENALIYLSYYKTHGPTSEHAYITEQIHTLNALIEKKKLSQSIAHAKQSATKSSPQQVSVQQNIALGVILLGMGGGSYFQYQAYNTRQTINPMCGRQDIRLICPYSVQDLRQKEEQELLYAGIGWGLMGIGILARGYLTFNYGSLSFSSAGIKYNRRF